MADSRTPSSGLRAEARRAFRRFSWPVTILTFEDGATVRGATISSVTSLSLDPPSLVLCVNRSSRTHQAVRVGQRFGLSLLGFGQRKIAERLSEPGADKVLADDELSWIGIPASPVLVGAATAFGITLRQVTPAFSHSVLVATIDASHVPDEATPPMAYLEGEYVSMR